MRAVPETNTRPDWPRLVAQTLNSLARRLDTSAIILKPGDAPADPVRGQVYYDQTADKLKAWDGTVWNDLW